MVEMNRVILDGDNNEGAKRLSQLIKELEKEAKKEERTKADCITNDTKHQNSKF